MIVDDFPEIRRRMLGEQKSKPISEAIPECRYCHGNGWHPNQFGFPIPCMICGNPKGLPYP